MNVLGPGVRRTSVGVKATASSIPLSGFSDRSQMVSFTCDDWNRSSTFLMLRTAANDRGDCELT